MFKGCVPLPRIDEQHGRDQIPSQLIAEWGSTDPADRQAGIGGNPSRPRASGSEWGAD